MLSVLPYVLFSYLEVLSVVFVVTDLRNDLPQLTRTLWLILPITLHILCLLLAIVLGSAKVVSIRR